jgi:LysM repeat protein
VANGEILGTATVGEDGQWSFPAAFDPGDYSLSVRAVDADGQVLAESDAVSFQVEEPLVVEAPTLTLPDEFPASGELTLSGTGTPGSTIQIVANGEILGTATVGEDGQWSFPAAFDPGDYSLSVRAVDADGQVLAESETITLTSPESVTALVLLSPTGEVELQSGVFELSGRGEPGSEVEILDNGEVIGTAVVSEEGQWEFSHEFAAGEHALAVQYAGDPASRSEATNVSFAQASTCVGEPPHGIDRGDTYEVARCEYMGIIAERTGVTLAELIAANPQVTNPSLIFPGQILKLPPRD